MAECGQRAFPSLGEELNRRLTQIHGSLAKPVGDRLTSAAREVEAELAVWAGRAIQHHAESEREMQEIIAALARTAESVLARDEKYSEEIGSLGGELRGIAGMSNLGEIRRAILESAGALRNCVEKMAQENKRSVHDLSAQLEEYRERLRVSEHLSTLDPLTELANRRAFEKQLQYRIEIGKPFALIFIDLNDFKTVNDRYGHLAGDDLLRQFGGELRTQFRANDLVARWGGDEFAVLVTGGLTLAEGQILRIRRWALGEYNVRAGAETVKVTLDACLGAAEWNGTESGEALMVRADAIVYDSKDKYGGA
jgi:diguanylate cyclase (GGDEF)-like protein